MSLRDHFERIYVINLSYKAERRMRLEKHLADIGLAEASDLTWARAISGEICPPPAYFKAGGGAWGCLQSHLRIAQDASMDQISNYLVLEDDVVFHERAPNLLSLLMDQVPDDWDQIYLGGQHLHPPEHLPDKPMIFKCRNINRTHAFAVNSKAFREYQQHITEATDYIEHAPWHIDHQLGLAHERALWSTYAPTWWLAGQEEGSSNISGRVTPRYWWHYQGFSEGLPFTHFSEISLPDQVADLNRSFHFGFNLKPNSAEDIGLDDCIASPEKLKMWLEMIAREAIDLWKLPAISHPKIQVNEVANVWKANVVLPVAANTREMLNYPWNGLFPHFLNHRPFSFHPSA